jgi:hypothetical protein
MTTKNCNTNLQQSNLTASHNNIRGQQPSRLQQLPDKRQQSYVKTLGDNIKWYSKITTLPVDGYCTFNQIRFFWQQFSLFFDPDYSFYINQLEFTIILMRFSKLHYYGYFFQRRQHDLVPTHWQIFPLLPIQTRTSGPYIKGIFFGVIQ